MAETEWTREDSERVAEAVRPVVAALLRLDRVDLEDALWELQRYEAAAPVLDPTGYRDGGRAANDRALERLQALADCYDRLLLAGGAKEDLDPEKADALGDWQAAIMEAELEGCFDG